MDDGSVDGHAELKCIEDKIFKPMEMAMVIPPAEIHSFTAQEEGTFILTIVGGNYGQPPLLQRCGEYLQVAKAGR